MPGEAENATEVHTESGVEVQADAPMLSMEVAPWC
jgi:hypothetical protein